MHHWTALVVVEPHQYERAEKDKVGIQAMKNCCCCFFTGTLQGDKCSRANPGIIQLRN
jgi:hypothetical protein